MAFASIIAIIAIVLVAGGIIAFLGHMIIGLFDSDRKINNTSKKEVLDYNQYKQLEDAKTVDSNKEYDFESINLAKAEKEKEMAEKDKSTEDDVFSLIEQDKDDEIEEIENRLKNEQKEQVETKPEEIEETAANEAEDDDFASLFDEISNDVVEEEKEKIREQDATPTPVSNELDKYSINNVLTTTDAEEDQDEVEEEEDSTEPEEVEEAEANDENLEKLDQANQEIADLKAQLEEMNKKLEEARNQQPEVSIDMTEEECLNRLATLEERLKNAKREYKVNMKEYRPLKKVMKDLEKYQTKLRRKDAILVKKKVALYGVNNYVDIDKEKAQKLADEIELLDGLRLSVSQCEEIINANKDRYPILEHTNKILEEQIANIEADIETTKQTLQKIRDKKGEGNNEGDEE